MALYCLCCCSQFCKLFNSEDNSFEIPNYVCLAAMLRVTIFCAVHGIWFSLHSSLRVGNRILQTSSRHVDDVLDGSVSNIVVSMCVG